MHRRALPLFSLCLLALAGCSWFSKPDGKEALHDFKGLPTPRRGFYFEPDRFGIQADNGMRVVVAPDFTTDNVEVGVRYEVGAIHDPPGKGGLAHLVEHLLFEVEAAPGSERTLWDRLDDIAIYNNASTTLESTHYTTIVHRDHLEEAFEIEAQRLRADCGALSASVIEREKEVVKRELAERGHGVENDVYDAIVATLYPEDHPYRRRTGGTPEEVSRLTKKDVCTFIDRHYFPENALMVVSGPLYRSKVSKAIDILDKVEKKGTKSTHELPALEKSAKELSLSAAVDEQTLVAAWPVDPRHVERGYLSLVIAQRLTAELLDSNTKDRFAEHVALRYIGGRQRPYLAVIIELIAPDAEKKARDALDAAFDEVSTEWDKSDVFVSFLINTLEIFSRYEPLSTRSSVFADYVQFGNMSLLSGDLEILQEIETDYIATVAKYIFSPKMRSILSISPEDTKYRDSELDAPLSWNVATAKTRRSHAHPDQARIDEPLTKLNRKVPKPSSFVLDNGLRVIIQPVSTTPSVEVTLLVPRKFSSSSEHLEVARATAALLHESAGENEKKLSGTLLDSPFLLSSADADLDMMTFRVRGFSFAVDFALHGLAKRVMEGSYDAKGVERYKENVLRLRSKRKKKSESVDRWQEAKLRAIFGDSHPYASTTRNPEDWIERLTPTMLEEYRQANLGPTGATLIIRGDVGTNLVTQHTKRAFEPWKPSGGTAEPTELPYSSSPGTYALQQEHRPYVQVSLLYPIEIENGEQEAAWLVHENLLEERTRSIRESLGASYGVHTTLERTRFGSFLRVSTKLNTATLDHSLPELVRLIEDNELDELFLTEFASSRRFVLRKQSGILTGGDALQTLLETGVRLRKELDAPAALLPKVATMRPEKLAQAVFPSLRPKKRILFLVGDKEAIERAAMTAGLDPTWLD